MRYRLWLRQTLLIALLHAVAAAGQTADVTYTYDGNGNQTSRTIDGETTHFAYDARDRLIQITDDAGTTLARYYYDYQGRLVRKVTPAGGRNFVYDDELLLLETDDSGATVARYHHGPGGPFSVESGGNAGYYQQDALGSPTQISRPDGSVDSYKQYDAWGNVREQVQGTLPDTYGFTGYRHDAEMGGYYARARRYDPAVGRFLTEDPQLGTPTTPGSLHRYLYAYSNPTVWVDPSGEIQELVELARNLAEEREAVLAGEVDQGVSGAVIGDAASRAINAGVLGLLQRGVNAANFAANMIVTEALPPDHRLRQEADEELGELAMTIEQSAHQLGRIIAEDPQGGLRAVVEIPSGMARQALDTAFYGSERERVELAANSTEVMLEALFLGGATKRLVSKAREGLSPPMTSGLPRLPSASDARFIFDSRASRYRDLETGRFVSARDLPYPPNRGFASSVRTSVSEGTVVARYGPPSGRYAAPPGASVSDLGLPVGSEDLAYSQYRVVRAFEAEAGPAAPVPEFGARGGALQYYFDQSVEQLVDAGYLEPIP